MRLMEAARHRWLGRSTSASLTSPSSSRTPSENLRARRPDPNVLHVAPRLAIRNLLRGYLMRLPTGQAVANRLGEPVLSGEALVEALPPVEALRAAARLFADRTPLWFYVLAEAGDPNGAKGQHLGRVGSRLLAEVLWNLVRHSETPYWPMASVQTWSAIHLLNSSHSRRAMITFMSGSISPWPVIRIGHRTTPCGRCSIFYGPGARRHR